MLLLIGVLGFTTYIVTCLGLILLVLYTGIK